MTTAWPVLRNDRLLRAARSEPVDKTPVWIMRQAGRYLPEFREVRKQHDFFTLCRTPPLACEVTLQPIRRYAGLFDASILFSDILVVPQALGLEVQMLPGEGPHFPAPLRTPEDLERLQKDVDVGKELGYVMEAMTMTRKALDGQVPLYGFSGAPWTLMAYMIEGGGSKTFSLAKRWLTQYPEASHTLLKRITEVTVEYLFRQVQAGGQALQVFDSWAGELSPSDFRTFSLPYLRQIVAEVKQRCRQHQVPLVPMVVFAKGAHYALEDLFNTEYDVIGLDWTMEVRRVKQLAIDYLNKYPERRSKLAFQGNLDPTTLYAPPAVIQEKTEKMLREFLLNANETSLEDGRLGYICNLGHGIQPEVPVDNVQVFLETVEKVSKDLLSRYRPETKGKF